MLPLRLALVLLPALGLAGAVFVLAVAAPRYLAIQHYPSTPQQPIYFDHRVHVEQAGLDCAFCHRTASTGVTAGYPDVEQCIGCHVVVSRGERTDEIEKLRQAWIGQRPIDWQRIHRLPDHSRFPHAAHVQAGVAVRRLPRRRRADGPGGPDPLAQDGRLRGLPPRVLRAGPVRRLPLLMATNDGTVTRRHFLRVVTSTTLGAVAFTGCKPPPHETAAQSRALLAEDVLSAYEDWYATACRGCAAGCGAIVRVIEGRAKKVEGTPGHPVNQGKLCARGQALVQEQYHPDRIQGPLLRTGPRGSGAYLPISWDDALERLATRLRELGEAGRGDAVALLTRPLAAHPGLLVRRFAEATGARRLVLDPLSQAPLHEAIRRVFGTDRLPGLRPPERPVHPLLRRRLPLDLALARPLRRRLRHLPPGPVRRGRLRAEGRHRPAARLLRPGRAALLHHRRQRRPLAADPARHRGAAGPGAGPGDRRGRARSVAGVERGRGRRGVWRSWGARRIPAGPGRRGGRRSPPSGSSSLRASSPLASRGSPSAVGRPVPRPTAPRSCRTSTRSTCWSGTSGGRAGCC